MDYELRKRLYELDEIGFIGYQSAKEIEKDRIIASYLIQASRKMWKTQKRGLTDMERKRIIKEAECAYKQSVQQGEKMRTFDKIASITL